MSNVVVKSFVCLQDKGTAATPGKSNMKQETSKSSPPESKISPGTKRPPAGGKSKGDSGGKKAKRAEKKEEEVEKTPGGQRPKNSKRRSIASKVSYKEESNSDEEQQSDDDFEAMSWGEDSTDSEREAKSAKKKGERRSKQGERGAKRRSSGGKKHVKEEDQERDENEEFEEERGGTRRGNRAKQRNGKKKEGPGADEWLEVYLDKTSSWVCVDVEHGVGLPHLCSQNATAPMTYVVSVDGDGFVKDLGRKYDPTWMTSSRKRRVDEEWWEETLEPFLGPEDERDRKEDKEVKQYVLLLISNSVDEE